MGRRPTGPPCAPHPATLSAQSHCHLQPSTVRTGGDCNFAAAALLLPCKPLWHHISHSWQPTCLLAVCSCNTAGCGPSNVPDKKELEARHLSSSSSAPPAPSTPAPAKQPEEVGGTYLWTQDKSPIYGSPIFRRSPPAGARNMTQYSYN